MQVLVEKGMVSTFMNITSMKLINARYLSLFIGDEVKIKRVHEWVLQVDVYMEIQCLVPNLKWSCIVQTLLKDHALD
jgi:hypothetical protein